MLELKNVKKSFLEGGMRIDAVKGIDLSFPERGLFFLVGKSGCGKSTLLNVMGSLENPSAGEVLYGGKPLSKMTARELDEYRARVVSFVFQEKNVFPALTVRENILFTDRGADPRTIAQRLGIGELLERRVNELSGGQLQRVAIARALVRGCRVLLADEPTGNLDQETAKGLFTLLKELSRERLVIVVTHDRESAEAFGDAVIYLRSGQVERIGGNSSLLSSPAPETLSAESAPLPAESAPLPAAKEFSRRRTYAGKAAVSALFGRKVKSITAVVLSLLVMLCMIFAFCAHGGEEGVVEARYLGQHNDLFSYALLEFADGVTAESARETLPSETDGLIYSDLGFEARSLSQLTSFGFTAEGCAPVEEDIFYLNAGGWGMARLLDEDVWGQSENVFGELDKKYYNCIIVDGEEVPFLESGLAIEDCTGSKFRLYAYFLARGYAPEEVPVLTLGGIVSDGFSGLRYDTQMIFVYVSAPFIFCEGGIPSSAEGALVPVGEEGQLLQTVRKLNERGLLDADEFGARDFYVVDRMGDWVITIPTLDLELRSVSYFAWTAAGVVAAIYLVLMLNIITVGIREKRSEVALMRALGLTRGQVFGGYFKAVCLFVFPVIVLAWALVPALVGILNLVFSPEFLGTRVYLIFIEWLPFACIGAFGVASALVAFLAALILLSKIPLAAAMRKEA